MNELDFSMHSLAKEAKNRLCRERTEFELYLATCTALQDEIMYEKVCQMMTSKTPICNPIDRLIDKSKFRQGDEAMKQKMVLDMSKKYIKMKRKFYDESNHNRG